MKFSTFADQNSVKAEPCELGWEEIVELFAEHRTFDGDKSLQMHFNGTEFNETQYRNYENIEAIHILVLDYDGEMTLAEARAYFSDLEYCGYTSYNHRVDKKDGKGIVDRFRLIMPLSKPCPKNTWLEINHTVKKIAPGVDPSCARPHQPFAIPIVREDGAHLSWRNRGVRLDWEDWERISRFDRQGNIKANPVNRSEHVLHPNDTLQTENGHIIVGEITGTVNGVVCPFHPDKKGGEFAKHLNGGSTYLVCKHCGTIFMEEEKTKAIAKALATSNVSAIADAVASFKKKTPTVEPKTLTPLISPLGEKRSEPYPRERRSNLLIKNIKRLKPHTLLYAFEGYGKSSQSVLYWLKQKEKVIIACMSNKQVDEQAESFRKANLKVQTIHSREYIIQNDYGIKPRMFPPAHPWAGEGLDEGGTTERMKAAGFNDKKIEEIWEYLEEYKDEPNFDEYDIVITTHARLIVWGTTQFSRLGWKRRLAIKSGLFDEQLVVPRGTIILFDDPSVYEFTRLKKFEKRFEDAKVGGRELEIEEIGGPTDPDHGNKRRKYFVRPLCQKVGYGLFETKMVFTTTELLTAHVITESYDDVAIPKLLPDGKMIAGKITMIKSQVVRSKYDGVLPVLFERLKKEGYKCEYFADAQGNEFNLTNSRGQNIFTDLDTLVEISLPHDEPVTELTDSLGLNFSMRESVRATIALDALQQAIGRNCGYRWSDKTFVRDSVEPEQRVCVVLVEPRLCNKLLQEMRYYVKEEDVIDADKQGGHLARRYDDFKGAVEWYVRNWQRFLMEGLNEQGVSRREFDACVRLAAENCPPKGMKQRSERLMKMIGTLIKEMKSDKGERLDEVTKAVLKSFAPATKPSQTDSEPSLEPQIDQTQETINKLLQVRKTAAQY